MTTLILIPSRYVPTRNYTGFSALAGVGNDQALDCDRGR